jgi:hypothetical protein
MTLFHGLTENTINDLNQQLQSVQQHEGQGFTAFLSQDYTATHSRLPFQRVVVDTMGKNI